MDLYFAMKQLLFTSLGLVGLFIPSSSFAQTRPTDRVPLCLQFPDNKTYVPCTGVVPVDKATGNPLSWGDAVRGTNTSPSYVQETGRRAHWLETNTPLSSSGNFTGTSRDDGSPINGGSSQWGTFNCFAWADQAGTLSVQMSNDNVTWSTVQSQPWAPMSSIYIVQPIFTKYSRCAVTNGSTTQGSFVLYSSFGK